MLIPPHQSEKQKQLKNERDIAQLCLSIMHHAMQGLPNRRRIYIEETTKVVAAVWGKEFYQFIAARAILRHVNLKNRMNSSFSSHPPGAILPFFHFILVQFFLFFISSWCSSSFLSFLHIILVQFFLFFISSSCKTFKQQVRQGI